MSLLCFRLFFLFLITLFPQINFSAENENNSAEMAYQNCVDSWIKGLTQNYPTITAIDIKYVAQYYCLCAMNAAENDTSMKDSEKKQKQIYKKCMPYATLRNTLHYVVETPTGRINPGAGGFYGACQFAFPHDAKNKDDSALVANFCECAAKPLAAIQDQEKVLKEDQIKDKVSTLAADCWGRN